MSPLGGSGSLSSVEPEAGISAVATTLPGTGRHVPVLVPAAAPLERAKYPSTSTATRACPATVANQIRPVSDTGTIAVAALEPSIPSDTTRGPLAPGAPEPDSHPGAFDAYAVTRTATACTPVFGSPFLPTTLIGVLRSSPDHLRCCR